MQRILPSKEGKFNPLLYILLVLPFLFAFISWRSFPTLSMWLSQNVFNYKPIVAPTNPVWSTTVTFYYSWFTFLAIGVGGLLAAGALLSRCRVKQKKMNFYPMVSFVVPAFNEESRLMYSLNSLYECGSRYRGPVEIIVVDDGSTDNSYEIAFAVIQLNKKRYPEIRGRVIRHMTNLGKVEAIRTGTNRALGQYVATVDADTTWRSDALQSLMEYMESNGKVAVTGYVHPINRGNPYTILQQLEYSQGLAIFRCAQALGNAVLVVPGAIGLFDANILREILNNIRLYSVTEDLEITLELQKRGYEVGYLNSGRCDTMAPSSFQTFWGQRSRWFVGWLHNTLGIHRDILLAKRWLSLLLWYCLIVEYAGAFIELFALGSFPFLYWFAPDKVLFLLNLVWFGGYALIIGLVLQAIALRFAYGEYNHKWLLYYTPFYSILRFINLCARIVSSIRFLRGYRGKWEKSNVRVRL